MGNFQCESRMCCKGESVSEEIRLAAEAPDQVFGRSLSSHSVSLSTHIDEKGEPFLGLKVLSSTSLPANSLLRIGPLGYEHSLRGAKDGGTYFGCKKRAGREGKRKGEVLNDVVMTITDRETAEKHRGRHFEILYRADTRSYWLRDLGVGFGAFLRLDEPARLKDNTLVNVGESFAVANFEMQDRPRLKLKLFGGPCKGEVYFFAPEDYATAYIRIGRAQSSEIVIDDNLISKCHASMWKEEQGWMVADGDAEKRKPSTNGTW